MAGEVAKAVLVDAPRVRQGTVYPEVVGHGEVEEAAGGEQARKLDDGGPGRGRVLEDLGTGDVAIGTAGDALGVVGAEVGDVEGFIDG